ncbi:amidase [Haloplanus rallus]|jgi:amidase|nr:amidase [Haloplanus rallus]
MELGRGLSLDLSKSEAEQFQRLIADSLETYETLRTHGPQVPETNRVETGRRSGSRPSPGENPNNAWITRCEISEKTGGTLSGWRIAIKDNAAVAGVEMTCASRVVEGYTPDIDATVVSRLLDEGATIIGKTNMDDMAFTIRGYPSAFGPVYNPHDDDHLAGGSSGGSAVVVATGEADAAIGSDQGGSIRIPAAHCGVVGFKPTFGLVPYTGGVGLETGIDHFGPMTETVADAAQVLTAIAGKDPNDARQPPTVPSKEYGRHLDGELTDLSIGVLSEGFAHEELDGRVEESVRGALDELSDAGATLREISVPLHADAAAIHFACIAEGVYASVQGEGLGHHHRSWYDEGWADAFGKSRRLHADEFPPEVKNILLLGKFMSESHHSTYYTRAMNLRSRLERKYNEALSDCDVLAMPTTLQTAPQDVSEWDRERRLHEPLVNLANTCAFNRTGHPALSVPVVPVDDLPVGLMLVGNHFDDETVLEAGTHVEGLV